MEPRAKLWIEEDGRIVLSEYRVRLLQLIDDTGSLAEAASRMGLSYRRAWGKVREIEANLGLRLVDSAAGGAGGGGSHLTADAKRLVRLFAQFRRSTEQDISREFKRIFDR